MKFAFITPRYGADIAGGPEHVCRLFAEQVSGRHHVDDSQRVHGIHGRGGTNTPKAPTVCAAFLCAASL